MDLLGNVAFRGGRGSWEITIPPNTGTSKGRETLSILRGQRFKMLEP